MTLKEEIQQILSTAKTALSVNAITLLSRLTKYESRVGEACRELADTGILKLGQVKGGTYYGIRYQINANHRMSEQIVV